MGECPASKALALGMSSSTEIDTMIPPVAARANPMTFVDRMGMRIAAARQAPAISLIPERNDQKNAFFLLLVAA
jgi:hypothetical protein